MKQRLLVGLVLLNCCLAALAWDTSSATANEFPKKNCCKTSVESTGDNHCCVDCCWGFSDDCSSSKVCPEGDNASW